MTGSLDHRARSGSPFAGGILSTEYLSICAMLILSKNFPVTFFYRTTLCISAVLLLAGVCLSVFHTRRRTAKFGVVTHMGRVCYGVSYAIKLLKRNPAIADKPRDAFVQMQRHGRPAQKHAIAFAQTVYRRQLGLSLSFR